MWRKGNSRTLLVGMPTGAATVENSMEIPQKTKHRDTIQSSSSTSRNLPRKNENTSWNSCTPLFMAALFTIVKIWKQPKCPSIDKWVKKMWRIYRTEYSSVIKNKEILPFMTT